MTRYFALATSLASVRSFVVIAIRRQLLLIVVIGGGVVVADVAVVVVVAVVADVAVVVVAVAVVAVLTTTCQKLHRSHHLPDVLVATASLDNFSVTTTGHRPLFECK